ncbi:MAG: geranylgeranyl reductase family protein [Candidatus Humimicrobiaceae bacterium]
MKKNFDVIISGAGPSGSLLGYLLSKKNISTLILEKEIFPRYKVCAGGIQWKALQFLPYDINEIIEKKIYGIYFTRRLKDIFYKKYSEPLIYTFERTKLDDFMAKKAIESGCSINFSEKIKNFEIGESEVKIFTQKDIYFSKILVCADGAGSIICKKLNKDTNLQKIIGYETEILLTSESSYPLYDESIVLDFGGIKKGYVWIFPKKHTLSIGGGGPVKDALNIKNYLKWFLQNYQGELNKNFAASGWDYLFNKKLSAHFIPVRSNKSFLCDYRVLSVGDAAGLGDAFTGEGIHNALLSSIIASDSISNAFSDLNFNFSDYREKINNDIYTNIKNSMLISKIFFSSPYFYYKLIKSNDNLFNSCAKILRGEKKYSDVVNKLKLIKI